MLVPAHRRLLTWPRALQACLRALGFPAKKKDVLADLQPYNKDQSSDIDFDTFEEILRQHYLSRDFTDLVDRAFSIFDADGKGYINHASLKAVVRELGDVISEDEMHDMIKVFDKDNDGLITKDDFRRILKVYNPDRADEDSDDDFDCL
jgi:Ca2+-binding EF-hand superfamily protein